jgi:hypothetical protein
MLQVHVQTPEPVFPCFHNKVSQSGKQVTFVINFSITILKVDV